MGCCFYNIYKLWSLRFLVRRQPCVSCGLCLQKGKYNSFWGKETRLRCRKRRFSAVVFKSSQMEIQLKNFVLNLGYRFTNWLCSCVAFKQTAVFILNWIVFAAEVKSKTHSLLSLIQDSDFAYFSRVILDSNGYKQEQSQIRNVPQSDRVQICI